MKHLLLIVAACLAVGSVVEAEAKSCPPGLAKKNPPCVPPGQAKKGVRYWAPGDYIGDEPLHWITYFDRYGLPTLAPGQRYVIIGNRVYAVAEDTYTILSVLKAVDAILD